TVFVRDQPIVGTVGMGDEQHCLRPVGERRYQHVRARHITEWGWRRRVSAVAGQRHINRGKEDVASGIVVGRIGKDKVLVGLARYGSDNSGLVAVRVSRET